VFKTLEAAPTLNIASNTITPTSLISFVGAGAINTITNPFTPGAGGIIFLIPTAAFTISAIVVI